MNKSKSSANAENAPQFWSLVGLRRWLHQHPELSHQETKTADFIERTLVQVGCTKVFRPASHSVCALVGDSREVVVIRCDIDALPIQESDDGRPYLSRNSGVMHACGHDAHSAMGIDLVRRFVENPPTGPTGVLVIFQQAEEVHPSGAGLVIDGLRNTFEFRAAFAAHVWPELECGCVGLRSGSLLAGIDGFTLKLRDSSPRIIHGTKAEAGTVDLILCMSSIIMALKPWLRGRSLTDSQRVVMHIGTISGGTLPNRFAEEVHCRGSVRWLDCAVRDQAWHDIQRIVTDTCKRLDATPDLSIQSTIRPAVINDAQLINFLREAASVHAQVHEPYPVHPLGVSDDFGLYGDVCPSAMLLVGSRKPGSEVIHLHDPRFDIDERALDIGAAILEAAVRRKLTYAL